MDVLPLESNAVNPGPVDGSVLYDQDKHVSSAVWDGQCWSYYHLNIGRPKLKHDPAHDCFPYVLRWKGKQIGPTANRDVVFYRKALDALKPCDNSGLRDIAHIADTFSTEGLDPQQIESISKIRYIAHECLRGQVDSPVVPAGTTMTELGKRSRGKEKVRRRSFGKRKQKDEPMDCDEISEDDRSHFHGTVIKVDELSLDNTDLDGTPHLCGLDHEDPSELCVVSVDGGSVQLCTDPGNGEVHHLQQCGIDGTGSNVDQLYGAAQVDGSQLGYVPNGIDGGQACDEMKELHDSQYLNSMEEEVVDESQLSHVVVIIGLSLPRLACVVNFVVS
ncbi:hypothetical protein CDL15_Pgr001431 [Punica granatum]|uniref:Aminotransferase-like plant mobile domain-containing protein n=1 Tax=Punica granatum TaxID=22663 RepID=A0A218WKF8_PUNGR|nr:hypothetical protein CDL15_Pgr001431 [Punica granatum]